MTLKGQVNAIRLIGTICIVVASMIAGAITASAQSAATDWVNPDTGRGIDEPARSAPSDQRRLEANREISWELGRLADRWDGLASDALVEELYSLSAFYEDGGLGARAGEQPRRASGAGRLIASDDFTDGDFDREPTWRPEKGGWLVDPAHGLRAVETGRGPALPSQDVVEAAYAADTFDSRASQLIGFALEAPNGVVLDARLTDHLGFGSAYLAVHQGAPRLSGYRIQVSSEQTPKVGLWRHSRSGANLLGVAAAPEIRQGRPVSIQLERTGAQQLVLRVDGRDAILARDATFKQGWSGFAFINTGGDFSLGDVSITASE